MVSYVSQDFLVLKMLPRAMNTEDRRFMTSSYMVLEHIPLNMMDQYSDYDDDLASS